MGMISDNLKEEIMEKYEKVKKHPEFYDQRRTLVIENLRSMGDVYSFWIENPELRMALVKGNKSEKTIKKEAQKGIQSIHNAWYFLVNKGANGRFVETLDEGIVIGTNGLVNGGSKEDGGYRTHQVTLNIPGFMPVNSQEVPAEVRLRLEVVKMLNKDDPLNAAIYAHMSLAFTQPFGDGNKRTARLLQDRILYDVGFPPAIIPAGEGKFYLDLIKRTAPAYRDNNDEGVRQFSDYMASKVNNGLDEILADLNV